MPWWVSMIIGALSVIFYDFFKTILKKCNMKPLLLRVCAFALTIVLCAVVAFAIKCAASSLNSTENSDSKVKSESYTQESDTIKDHPVTLRLEYAEGYVQILQFTATDLTYGMGEIIFDDKELLQDIRWDESEYAVRRQKLSKDQMDIIQKIISEAETLKFKNEDYAVKDGVIFTLYIKNKEIASGWVNILDWYPKNIEQAITELMDIASPFKMIKGYIE